MEEARNQEVQDAIEKLRKNLDPTGPLYLHGLGDDDLESLLQAMSGSKGFPKTVLFDPQVSPDRVVSLASLMRSSETVKIYGGTLQLSSLLMQLPKTRHLTLSKHTLTTADLQALATAGRHLTTLSLPRNNLTCHDIQTLVKHFKATPTLKTLDLRGNHIGDDGAVGLARWLKTNTSIEEINLSYNQIGNKGAKALAQALKTNSTVRSLVLSVNCIGDEGLRALADVLAAATTTTSSLQKLALDRNAPITENGIHRFGRYLVNMPSLQSLQMDRFRLIQDALAYNTTLVEVVTNERSTPQMDYYLNLNKAYRRQLHRNDMEALWPNALAQLDVQLGPNALFYYLSHQPQLYACAKRQSIEAS